jgi:hypothetical protein
MIFTANIWLFISCVETISAAFSASKHTKYISDSVFVIRRLFWNLFLNCGEWIYSATVDSNAINYFRIVERNFRTGKDKHRKFPFCFLFSENFRGEIRTFGNFEARTNCLSTFNEIACNLKDTHVSGNCWKLHLWKGISLETTSFLNELLLGEDQWKVPQASLFIEEPVWGQTKKEQSNKFCGLLISEHVTNHICANKKTPTEQTKINHRNNSVKLVFKSTINHRMKSKLSQPKVLLWMKFSINRTFQFSLQARSTNGETQHRIKWISCVPYEKGYTSTFVPWQVIFI